MSNKNWVCTACGRSFARRFSAQRHVNHLEGGMSAVIRKEQYDFGVRTGELVAPSRRPKYAKRELRFVDLVIQKAKEKLVETCADDMLGNPMMRNFLIMELMAGSKPERPQPPENVTQWISRRAGQTRTL